MRRVKGAALKAFLKSMVACSVGLIASTVVSQPANAQLAIDRLWVDFDSSGVPRSDLVVRNESKDRYYITIKTTEIVSPGTDQEQRVAVTDPEKLGLLVTPNRLILEPGQMRAVRMVSLNSGLTDDRIYRVNITPQIGELEVENGQTENRGLAVKLLAAFDVLVTVRPDAKNRTLAVRRFGNFLDLSNDGNSNVLLLDGAICPVDKAALAQSTQDFIRNQDLLLSKANEALAAEKAKANPDAEPVAPPSLPAREFKPDECVKLPGRRMYSGNHWLVPAAAGEALKFSRRDAANQDLEPIVVRCDAVADIGSKESVLCKAVSPDAPPETTEISPPSD